MGWRLRKLPAGLLVLALSGSVWAELGGGLNSVQADQAQLQAKRQVLQAEGYSVHEMQAPSGTVVREYASPAGTVFGVTWNGPFIPDLRQLLGAQHFAEFQQAQQSRRPGRHPIDIEQPGLVVQMSGRPRSFHGRAYVPGLIPQGVEAAAIR
jgi:hypothetical protein